MLQSLQIGCRQRASSTWPAERTAQPRRSTAQPKRTAQPRRSTAQPRTSHGESPASARAAARHRHTGADTDTRVQTRGSASAAADINTAENTSEIAAELWRLCGSTKIRWGVPREAFTARHG